MSLPTYPFPIPPDSDLCDACGQPDCPDKHLCNVKALPEPVPVEHVYLPSLAGRLQDGCENHSWFEEWASVAVGFHEGYARHIDELERFKQVWDGAGRSRAARMPAVVGALALGLEIRAAAQFFETHVDELLRVWMPLHEPKRLLALEELARKRIHTDKELSRLTGIQSASIKVFRTRLGILGRGHHTAEVKAEAVARVVAGEKRADVARSLGVPYATVQAWTTRLGPAARSGRFHSNEAVALARRMHRNGATSAEISEATGIPPRHVANICLVTAVAS